MDEVDPVVEKAVAEVGITPVILAVGDTGETGSGDAKYITAQSADGESVMLISEDARGDSEIQDQGTTGAVSYVTAVGDQGNVMLQVAGDDDNTEDNQTYILTTDEAGDVIQHIQQGEGQVIMQDADALNGEPQVIHVQADGQTEFDLSSAQIVTMRGESDGTTQYITLPTSHSGQVFTLPVNLPDGTTQTQIITLPQEYSQLPSSGGQLVFSMPDVSGNQTSQVITSIPSMEQPIYSQAVPSAEPVIKTTLSFTESPVGKLTTSSNIRMKPISKPPPRVKVVQPQKKKAPPKAPKPPPVPPPPPKPDLENPIQLSDETIVVVGGKKCFLRCNPDTGEFKAYPVKQEVQPGKRKRGRPRKEEREFDPHLALYKEDQQAPDGTSITLVKKGGCDTDQTNSAAEGLLELCNVGPDGVRRSARRKKQARVLSDYELGAVLSDEETEDMIVDDGAVEYEEEDGEEDEEEIAEEAPQPKRGRGRPRKYNLDPSMSPALARTPSNPAPPGVKRGRGRPRRNPAPVHQPPDYTGPIPALIIANANGGQTIMLAPGQNLQTLQKLPPLLPKLTTNTEAGKTPVHVVVQSMIPTVTQEANRTDSIQSQPNDVTSEIEAALTQICRHENPSDDETLQETEEAAVVLAAEGATQEIKVERVESPDSQSVEDDDNGHDAEQEDGDQTQDANNAGGARKGNENNLPEGVTAAMVQLPQDMIPTFKPGKTPPIILGLKANEDDLSQLRCPRCDFQGYYLQQYQDHLRAAHEADLEKCKCCNFATFEKEDLMKHFKVTHPRNICAVCEFTAEHAYVIKRHMMRHNAKGCECELCGRTYKDSYILKMHIKMVHMPAEVLFECTVCAKKFTRKAHLKRHLRIHDPEKPFKCPHCDYRGCEKSDITKHLLIHEEPKHCCEVCGKSFRHIKNKELHLKRHKGQRDYKCGVCDFYGYTFTDIRKHIERKHSENRIIACEKCGSTFKSEIMLREHQKRTCDLLMIEQAIAAAAANPSGQTSIVEVPGIPLSEMGQVSIDGSQVISVENIRMPDGSMVSLAEAQHLTETQLEAQQIAVSEIQQIDPSEVEMVTHISVSQGQIIDTSTLSMADPNALAGTRISSSDIVDSAVHIVDINDTTDPGGQDLDEGENEEIEHIDGVIQEGQGVIREGAEIHEGIRDGAEIQGRVIQVSGKDGQIHHLVLQEGGEIHQVIREDGQFHQVIGEGGQVNQTIEEGGQIHQGIEDDGEEIHQEIDKSSETAEGFEEGPNEIENHELQDNTPQVMKFSQLHQIAEVITKEQEGDEQV
ncbi:uncharacterized protein LOC135488651 isoform X2 [Lineus longissimus]|uniref:uncharacterized protein LOC135488651 isoform X2 n=1 Tax=Lineus longissimus TaxID=88925 RepID=UPI00315DA7DD